MGTFVDDAYLSDDYRGPIDIQAEDGNIEDNREPEDDEDDDTDD